MFKPMNEPKDPLLITAIDHTEAKHVAAHEAGHKVVGLHFGAEFKSAYISNDGGGQCLMYKGANMTDEQRALFTMAGPVAESRSRGWLMFDRECGYDEEQADIISINQSGFDYDTLARKVWQLLDDLEIDHQRETAILFEEWNATK